MYCTILYNPNYSCLNLSSRSPASGISAISIEPDKTMYINPDCPMKILLDHIRSTVGIDPDKEFDLCSIKGQLKNVLTYDESTYGTMVLSPFTSYICVLIDRAEDGSLLKFTPLVGKISDIALKLRRYITPSKRFAYDMAIKKQRKTNRSLTSRSNRSETKPSKAETSK